MKKAALLKKSVSAAVAIAIGSGLWVSSSAVYADSGFYLGGAFGLARVDGNDFEDDSSVLKAFVGGKFNSYIGVEAAIHDFNETSDGGFTSDISGQSLALVGFLPLTESLELFIKGGNLWWKNDIQFGSLKDSNDGTEIFYGVGANFYLNPNIAVRAEFERYEVELSSNEVGIDIDTTTDVDVASIGVVFSF
jgi:hypothetical protein